MNFWFLRGREREPAGETGGHSGICFFAGETGGHSGEGLEVVVAEVFAGGREVVVLEVGEEVFELEEEAFAGEVAVGIHVEGS